LKNTQTDKNMDNTYKTENKYKYNEDMTMKTLQWRTNEDRKHIEWQRTELQKTQDINSSHKLCGAAWQPVVIIHAARNQASE